MTHERRNYIKNLWNATFGLWKIKIMNGFIWKENKQTSRKQGTCNFTVLWEFSSITIFPFDKYL